MTNIHINYDKTMKACFLGFIVQAIINNFAPLLFLTFQSTYKISLPQITVLVTFNFLIQLVTDFVAITFITKIGYRTSAIMAHILCTLGLILLSFLPDILPSPFLGLLIATVLYAIGGGLLEVLINHIVETCTSDNKEKAMSILHSFYCWGYVGVVLLSTLFFYLLGINNWRVLCLLWAALPILNTFLFMTVPITPSIHDGKIRPALKKLATKRLFWIFVIIMICAGATEQGMGQWASTLFEKELGLSKIIGDLGGPMLFAFMMGLTRLLYGKYGEHVNLEKLIFYSSIFCVASFLAIALIPNPIIAFIACAVSGLSISLMWPGALSMAASSIKTGGIPMFGLLALAGDIGCSIGPSTIGAVSSYFSDDLKKGILAAIIFPIILILSLLYKKKFTVKP